MHEHDNALAGVAMDWPDFDGRLTGFGHEKAVRVYYEDTDFSGIVYHASYIRFIERGRSDFIRLLGILHSDMDDEKDGESVAFAVRHMDIDYLKTAKIDDLLIVETRVEQLKGARLILDQRIKRANETLFVAKVTLVIINRDGKPRRMPAYMQKLIGA